MRPLLSDSELSQCIYAWGYRNQVTSPWDHIFFEFGMTLGSRPVSHCHLWTSFPVPPSPISLASSDEPFNLEFSLDPLLTASWDTAGMSLSLYSLSCSLNSTQLITGNPTFAPGPGSGEHTWPPGWRQSVSQVVRSPHPHPLGLHFGVWASPAAVHRLSCSAACGILVPWLGIESVSPALEGGFLSTWSPGKSLYERLKALLKKLGISGEEGSMNMENYPSFT